MITKKKIKTKRRSNRRNNRRNNINTNKRTNSKRKKRKHNRSVKKSSRGNKKEGGAMGPRTLPPLEVEDPEPITGIVIRSKEARRSRRRRPGLPYNHIISSSPKSSSEPYIPTTTLPEEITYNEFINKLAKADAEKKEKEEEDEYLKFLTDLGEDQGPETSEGESPKKLSRPQGIANFKRAVLSVSVVRAFQGFEELENINAEKNLLNKFNFDDLEKLANDAMEEFDSKYKQTAPAAEPASTTEQEQAERLAQDFELEKQRLEEVLQQRERTEKEKVQKRIEIKIKKEIIKKEKYRNEMNEAVKIAKKRKTEAEIELERKKRYAKSAGKSLSEATDARDGKNDFNLSLHAQMNIKIYSNVEDAEEQYIAYLTSVKEEAIDNRNIAFKNDVEASRELQKAEEILQKAEVALTESINKGTKATAEITRYEEQEEAEAAASPASTQEKEEEKIDLKRKIKTFDVNEDGKISYEEFSRKLKALDVEERDIIILFVKLLQLSKNQEIIEKLTEAKENVELEAMESTEIDEKIAEVSGIIEELGEIEEAREQDADQALKILAKKKAEEKYRILEVAKANALARRAATTQTELPSEDTEEERIEKIGIILLESTQKEEEVQEIILDFETFIEGIKKYPELLIIINRINFEEIEEIEEENCTDTNKLLEETKRKLEETKRKLQEMEEKNMDMNMDLHKIKITSEISEQFLKISSNSHRYRKLKDLNPKESYEKINEIKKAKQFKMGETVICVKKVKNTDGILVYNTGSELHIIEEKKDKENKQILRVCFSENASRGCLSSKLIYVLDELNTYQVKKRDDLTQDYEERYFMEYNDYKKIFNNFFNLIPIYHLDIFPILMSELQIPSIITQEQINTQNGLDQINHRDVMEMISPVLLYLLAKETVKDKDYDIFNDIIYEMNLKEILKNCKSFHYILFCLLKIFFSDEFWKYLFYAFYREGHPVLDNDFTKHYIYYEKVKEKIKTKFKVWKINDSVIEIVKHPNNIFNRECYQNFLNETRNEIFDDPDIQKPFENLFQMSKNELVDFLISSDTHIRLTGTPIEKKSKINESNKEYLRNYIKKNPDLQAPEGTSPTALKDMEESDRIEKLRTWALPSDVTLEKLKQYIESISAHEYEDSGSEITHSNELLENMNEYYEKKDEDNLVYDNLTPNETLFKLLEKCIALTLEKIIKIDNRDFIEKRRRLREETERINRKRAYEEERIRNERRLLAIREREIREERERIELIKKMEQKEKEMKKGFSINFPSFSRPRSKLKECEDECGDQNWCMSQCCGNEC